MEGMWKRRALVAVTFALLTWSGSSAARSETERATDVASGAANPHKNSSNVAVLFDASASDLPEVEIRAAVARELGTSPDVTVLAAARTLTIAVDGPELVVTSSAPEGSTERRLSMPDDRAELPELLALLAVNLTRDQRVFAAVPAPVRSAPPKPAAAVAEAPAAPAEPRAWFGVHIAQDYFDVHSASVCNPATPGYDSNYSCWVSGTGQRYVPTYPGQARTIPGSYAAQSRLLLSYDHALTPYFSLGGRAGYGLNLMQRTRTAPEYPGHIATSPWQLEGRATLWSPRIAGRLQVLAGADAGLIEMQSNSDAAPDCSAANGTTNRSDFCGFTLPSGQIVNSQIVRLRSKVGWAFAGAHVGAVLALVGHVATELNVDVMGTFPTRTFAAQASLGVLYAL